MELLGNKAASGTSKARTPLQSLSSQRIPKHLQHHYVFSRSCQNALIDMQRKYYHIKENDKTRHVLAIIIKAVAGKQERNV